MKILEYLRLKNINQIQSPCGGKGTCKKCMVKILQNGVERQVLACQTEYEADMTVVLSDENDENQMKIIHSGITRQRVKNRVDGIVAACDIGTTTVVCHLVDGATGKVISTVAYPNKQRSFGADVISRIEAATHGKLGEMQSAIIRQIQSMLGECLKKSEHESEKIKCLSVAGNTVMCHIFAGISPQSIGKVPFLPQEYFGKNYSGEALNLEMVDQVYIAPAVSGYVGGDITSDMLALSAIMNDGEEVGLQKAGQFRGYDGKQSSWKSCETLILDIGTNGEMVLGKPGDYTCCATAAGPAFEGAEIELGMPAMAGAISKVWLEDDHIGVSVIGDDDVGKVTAARGICGTGLVDAIAIFLEMGLIDETGRIMTHREIPYKYYSYLGDEEEENDCIFLTDEVYVTQEDIRKLQLAKGAIAAGIKVLMNARNVTCDDIEKVIIAGGFGSVLDKKSAVRIGLIPTELLEKTEAIGNAAAEGAILAAISEDVREELDKIKASMTYIELSAEESFSEEYIRQINF